MWLSLHTIMVALVHGFSRSNVACKNKKIAFVHKHDKLANGVVRNDKHECKFYEFSDIKHVKS